MFCIDYRTTRFFSSMANITAKHCQQMAEEFDPNGMAVFSYVLNADATTGQAGGKILPITQIASEVLVSRYNTIKRLELLATFAVLNVIRESKRRAPEFVINPLVIRALNERTPMAEMQQVLTRLVRIGLARAAGTDKLQGFRSHVAFGDVEPVRVLTDEAGHQQSQEERDLFAEVVAQAERCARLETDKERKKREREERAALAARFIEVCAELWQRGQIAHGRMSAVEPLPPSWWAQDIRKLTDVNRREYRELEGAFYRYGTVRVGMAWRYFCGAKPLRDAKDRVQFIPDIPHIQWVSLDKKPSHFSKHLNALFTDPVFRDWLEDGARLAKVHADYGDELCAYQGDDTQPERGGAAHE